MVLFIAAVVLCFLRVESAQAQFQNDDGSVYELVLQMSRDGEVLSNAILGMQKGFTGYYLPLGGVAAVLGINIELDLERPAARGWYLRTDNPYEIDVAQGHYIRNGETRLLGADDVIVKDYGAGFGDIYVRLETLNDIWPLELALDFSKLKIDVMTPRKLPYELIRDRKERRAKLLSRRDNGLIDMTGFKLVDNPYQLYSPPVLDIRSAVKWGSSEDGVTQNNNISGRNDLLWFSADYNMNIDYRDGEVIWPDILRMTFTRRTFGEETMPLGIRELQLGDVGARTADLISGGNAGRGVSVSSRPFRRSGTFDEITVDGTAPPGWEVEIYRNSELLDFTLVNEAGQYRFDEVELLAGGNTIRTVLYGPEGQVEERIEEHSIGSGLLPPGELEYEATIVDTKNNLIEFDDSGRTGFGQQDDGLAYSGSARLGVNKWMSLFASGTKSAGRSGREKYVTAGTDLSLGPVKANIEAYKQIDGGKAIDTRLSTRLHGWRANLRTQFLNDFESNRAGYGDSAKEFDIQGNLSKRFPTSFGHVGLTVSGDHEEQKDEKSRTRFRMSNFASIRNQTIGNQLTATYRDHDLTAVSGRVNASSRFGRKWHARSLLSYEIKPHFELSFANIDLNYRHSKNLRGGVNAGRNLQTSKTNAGADVSYDFGSFLGSFSTNWDEDRGTNFIVRATTSLAPYGENGSYIMSSRSLKEQSAINAHVYLDKNLNHVYDREDEPVEDIVLLYDGREGEASTGTGFTNNIQSMQGRYASVELDEHSVTNPFHASLHRGFGVMGRRGVAKSLDFPLVETGVIDGTAYFENGRPVPGLRLQLVDGYGDVIKETLTSFDGFYTFEFVKPGGYVIRTDPSQNLNMPPRLATISPDALFAYGVNVKLLEKGGLEPSSIDIDLQVARQNQYPIIGALVRLQSKLRGAVSGS